MKSLGAQFQSLRILFTARIVVAVEETNACVQIPAVIIERAPGRERAIQSLDVFERHVLKMKESHDHIRDLTACVVYVVLHLHALARRLQDADEGVAQNGIANMAYVRGLIRIDRS